MNKMNIDSLLYDLLLEIPGSKAYGRQGQASLLSVPDGFITVTELDDRSGYASDRTHVFIFTSRNDLEELNRVYSLLESNELTSAAPNNYDVNTISETTDTGSYQIDGEHVLVTRNGVFVTQNIKHSDGDVIEFNIDIQLMNQALYGHVNPVGGIGQPLHIDSTFADGLESTPFIIYDHHKMNPSVIDAINIVNERQNSRLEMS